jgi:hypothetical protein
VVRLSDHYTTFPDSVPTVPVLWAVTRDNGSQPLFGDRISID